MNSQQRVLVKCGGFSSQLARRMVENIDVDPLWGSRYDATNPEEVKMTHLEYLYHGADIILSNTYQASIEGYMKYLNLSKEESIELMRKSVKLAKDARTEFMKYADTVGNKIEPGLPLVMASIGPYGAHLHDGSEYTGNYAERVSKSELQSWHEPRIEACLAEGVDGLAIETLPCQLEAEAVVELILNKYADVKFWVSFQCKDEGTLAHGEKFSDAVLSIWNIVKSANAQSRLYGIGTNCVNPRFVSPLFKSLRTLENTAEIPLIVYSNSGEIYDAAHGKWHAREKCAPLETFVPEWVALGARIIGGCCRVYPEDIIKIRKCIENL